MHLRDLKPHWIEDAGTRVAIMFLCPRCIVKRREKPAWLSCFFVPSDRIAGEDGQYARFRETLQRMGGYSEMDELDVVGCTKGIAWTRSGDDFATMSITPSIDASASGHWHGHITGGQIVGGL